MFLPFRVRRAHVSLVILLASSLLAGCGGRSDTKTLAVNASGTSLAAGGTMQLTATETNILGTTSDVTFRTNWGSSNGKSATVGKTGLVAGVAAGQATIVGTVDGLTANINLSIGKPGVAAITLSPKNMTITPGRQQAYVATATYANQTTGAVSTDIAWSVQPATVASISPSGVLTAIAPGAYVVAASYGSGAGSLATTVAGSVTNPTLASIKVLPANAHIAGGATQQFTATGTYSDNSSQDLSKSVEWGSSDAALLTLNTTGLATTQSVGTATSVTVTATLTRSTGAISGETTVQVAPAAALTQLVVEPTSSSIANHTAEPHTATAFYADGSQRDVSSQVTWSVLSAPNSTISDHAGNLLARGRHLAQPAAASPNLDSSQVLNITQGGTDTGTAAGTGLVQATLGAATSQSTVIVTPATAVSLQIKATKDLFPIGSTQPLQLIGTFSDGTTQDLSLTANWQTSDATIATIDNAGLATGIESGNVTFSATFGGLHASTTGFQVLPGTLLSTIIDVDYPTEPVGISEQLRLLGTYSDGTTHDLTQIATWTAVDADIFPVNSTGLAYALKAGTTQIVGTVFGKEAITTVLAIPVPVISLTVFANSSSFALGTTIGMVGVGNFNNGVQVDITKPCVWSSADPTILTVNADGRVKGGKVGTTTVTCALLGLSASTDISVTSATLTRLSISPVTSQVAAFTGRQYTAWGWLSDGTLQDVSSDVLWNTSDNTIASIDANGFGIGMRAGTVEVNATIGTLTGSVPLTVTDAILTSVTVSPGNSELPDLFNKQFTLIGTFSDGTNEDLTAEAVWTAPTPLIVAVTLKGEVLGVSPGTGPIAAQYGNFSASTPVHVTNATLKSLAITPLSTVIRVGDQQAMAVTGNFSDGATLDLGDINAFIFSSDSDVASYQTTSYQYQNFIFGVGVGNATITATLDGLTAKTTKFQVLSNVISSVAIAPANAAVTAGNTQQFTATATYADGSTGSLNSTTTWSSSNDALLSVDNNGLATAHVANEPATVTITAVSGAITSVVTVLVNPAGIAPTPTLAGLVVIPTSSHTAAGTPVQFRAIGNYTDGSTADLSGTVAWSVSSAAEASVSSTGTVNCLAPGTVTVTAASGLLQSHGVLVISDATLTSVAISPSGVSFPVGTLQPFTLTGSFSDGSEQNLSAAATWGSSASNLATISSTGIAAAIAPGSIQFTATFSGKSTSTFARVTPVTLISIAITPQSARFASGIDQAFTVTGTYTDGSTHDLTSQSNFLSSAPAVLNVTASGSGAGLAQGLTTGSAQITAAVDGDTATTESITITPATLTSIAIRPDTPTFADGTNEQFTAIATFSDGSTRDVTGQAVWSSSNPQTLTIDANGLASSDGIGTAQITATLNGISGTTGNATVTPAVLTGLALSPTSARIARGTSQQFTVTGTYSDGTTQNLSSMVAWSSSSSAVASIDANGLAEGTGVGTATLMASYQGSSAQAMTVLTTSFQVSGATLVSVAFDPANPSVAAGSSTQVTVTGTFSDGSTQNLTSSASYSSSNPAVVTVNSTGILTGVAAGSSEITVTVDGVTSDYLVTVSNATLVALAITPSSPAAFAKGRSEQLTATGTYSDGTTQNLSAIVNWLSSNTAVFNISNTGLATGTGTGSAVATANYQGQIATTPTIQVTEATVASIAVTPFNATAAIGATQQFTATATYTDGSTLNLSSSATFTSSQPSTATISSSGLATALASGTTTIGAQAGTISGSTTFTVGTGSGPTPTLTSIAVSPKNASLAAGNSLQYTATGTYSDGSASNLSAAATWASSNGAAATINTSGMASAIAAGSTAISASFGGLSSSTALTVTAAPVTLQSIAIAPSTASVAKGSPQQFTATGSYSDGSTHSLTTQVAWQSSASGVANINSSGLATTTAAGSTQISASLGGQSATATLTVGPAALSSLSVAPHTVVLANGTNQQYRAVGTMTDGGTQDLTNSVNWSSSNTSVATIASTGITPGLAAAHAAGSSTITAQSGTTNGTALLTVSSGIALSIQLTPSTVSLAAGQTQQLLATATFNDGSSQIVTSSVSYTSSNAGVATVSTNGVLTAVGAGTTTVTATLGLVSITGSVTVSQAILTSIAITPPNPNLPVGLAQQLAAIGIFSDGSTQDLTGSAIWESSEPSVASVSTAGNVLAAATGTTIITAISGSVSAETTTTVTNVVVTAIGVSPASVTLAAGQTQQFAATASLSDGTQQTVTSSAHWSVSNPLEATVSNSSGSNGFLTATAAGATNVIAIVNSTSGMAAVSIQAATLSSLAITPSPLSIPAGTSQSLAVTGTYSDGSTANITASSTFTSASSSTAAVNASGTVQGVSAGATTITAAVGNTSSTEFVTVTSAVLTSIAITPAAPSVALGLTKQLTATGTYSDGSTANITAQVQWASTSPSVATISGTGLMTTVTTGTSTILATLNSTAASATLTVNSASLQSISVTAAQNNFPLGLSLQLKAIGNYSDGTTEDLTSTVVWASQTPSVAVVSASGLATGHKTGTFNATATTSGVTGSFIVSVTNAVLQSIVVTPGVVNEILLLAPPIQFTATGDFSDGSTEDMTTSVLWTISNTLGSISPTGQLSLIAIGSGTVTATSGTIFGTASVSIIGIL